MAYIIPAVLAWGVLALVLYPLNALVSIGIFGGWLYAVTFGLMETLAIPFRTLGSSWQVPARWLQGRSPFVQMLVWGSTLGPGFMTRNPYAGIWLLPLLLILHANIWLNIEVGIVIGMIHGGSRAVGILVARRRLNTCGSSMLLHLAQWRWRLADGLLLLFIAGCIASLLLAPLLKLSH